MNILVSNILFCTRISQDWHWEEDNTFFQKKTYELFYNEKKIKLLFIRWILQIIENFDVEMPENHILSHLFYILHENMTSKRKK